MIATINGVTVMGTPQEIWEFQKLANSKEKAAILEDHRGFIEKMRWKLDDNKQCDRGDTTAGQYIYQGPVITSWLDQTANIPHDYAKYE